MGPFRLFQHPFRCKTPKKEGGPFEDFKKFRKSHKAKKVRGKSHSAEKLEGGPFWVLHFKVEAFGCVQNQVLSAFGKSEIFTKSGTYTMSEKSDEKKTSHCNSRALFTRKAPSENTASLLRELNWQETWNSAAS